MKLAVSNIAWNAAEDEEASSCLHRYEIRGLEVAPPRLWPRPVEVAPAELAQWRRETSARSLEVVALQSLLFGRDELHLFQPGSAEATMDYLTRMGELGAALGAGVLVLGSPRQRALPVEVSPTEGWELAVRCFVELGERMYRLGVVLGLEPNPEAYGGNFIHTIEEAARLVRAVDRPGFRLHLDAGEMQMQGEPIEEAVAAHADLLCHVHASEPMLAPLSGWAGHRRLAAALRAHGYAGWVSLEMKGPAGGLAEVEAAIARFTELYA